MTTQRYRNKNNPSPFTDEIHGDRANKNTEVGTNDQFFSGTHISPKN